MASDGTKRGGARPGAGRKPKALTDKVSKSKITKIKPIKLDGVEVPPIRDYFLEKQQCGKNLTAVEIQNETLKYLNELKVLDKVPKHLIEQYSFSMARWIQTEQCINELGFIAKHPTTGGAIASPYVQMAQAYLKQTNQLWFSIEQSIKIYVNTDEINENDGMDMLLTMRGV